MVLPEKIRKETALVCPGKGDLKKRPEKSATRVSPKIVTSLVEVDALTSPHVMERRPEHVTNRRVVEKEGGQ